MDYNLLIKHLLILKCFLIIMLLLGVEMDAWAHNNKTTGSLMGSENAIVQCNGRLIETIRTLGQQPPTIMPVRSYAIAHATMFDAFNSIIGTYTPDLTDVLGTKNASLEAAAQAAHEPGRS